MNCVAKL